MRFLFLCTKYSVDPADPYMTDELAGGLMARGHQVEVLHVPWDAPLGAPVAEVKGRNGEKVVQVPPRAWRRLGTLAFRASKFVRSELAAARALEERFDVGSFDAVVMWTPALTMRSPLLMAYRRRIPNRILFIFDFFPIAHREIGMIGNPLVYRVAKRLEDRLYRTFTAIVCNLPGNVDYLRRHYPVRDDQTLVSTPLWTDTTPPPLEPRDAVRERLGIAADVPVAIFGGQLSEGRGIEQMLGAAKVAEERGSPLQFLFMGDGRLAGAIRDEAARGHNVRYLPPVAREQYLSIVGACDVGLVATVNDFSSFSFPTKTIDYLRAGIPVVAAVEDGSDYFQIIERYQVGQGVRSGDAAAMFAAADRLARAPDRAAVGVAAARCLDEVFDLRHTVDTVLGVSARGAKRKQA